MKISNVVLVLVGFAAYQASAVGVVKGKFAQNLAQSQAGDDSTAPVTAAAAAPVLDLSTIVVDENEWAAAIAGFEDQFAALQAAINVDDVDTTSASASVAATTPTAAPVSDLAPIAATVQPAAISSENAAQSE